MPDHAAVADACGIARVAGKVLIGGEWRSAREKRPSVDPTTSKPLADVAMAGTEEVDAAVASARAALEGEWGRMGVAKRRATLHELAELTQRSEKDLAQIEALDVGTPVVVGKRFTAKAAGRTLAYYASWADKIYGDVVPLGSSQAGLDYTLREPVGVVAAVLPWNTPLVFIGSKVGAALACGNTVVIKPSEIAPLSVLRWAELCAEAGLPPGVVNVIPGDGATGEALASHPDVDLVSFTGGSQTGPKVARAAAGKPLALELGGKSAAVVFPDADLDKAAMAAGLGCFGLTGQACAASSRILVHDDVHDALVERLANVARVAIVGDPLEPMTMIGPLVSPAQSERVASYVKAGAREGGTIVVGGERIDRPGSFFQPTVIDGVTRDMTIARQEIFGPVIAVMRFSTEEEAVQLANATSYGLAAGVFTRDVSRVHRTARRLRAGIVWVNGWGDIPSSVPFGGVKGSGYGREGGRDALATFTTIKNVLIEL